MQKAIKIGSYKPSMNVEKTYRDGEILEVTLKAHTPERRPLNRRMATQYIFNGRYNAGFSTIRERDLRSSRKVLTPLQGEEIRMAVFTHILPIAFVKD